MDLMWWTMEIVVSESEAADGTRSTLARLARLGGCRAALLSLEIAWQACSAVSRLRFSQAEQEWACRASLCPLGLQRDSRLTSAKFQNEPAVLGLLRTSCT